MLKHFTHPPVSAHNFFYKEKNERVIRFKASDTFNIVYLLFRAFPNALTCSAFPNSGALPIALPNSGVLPIAFALPNSVVLPIALARCLA